MKKICTVLLASALAANLFAAGGSDKAAPGAGAVPAQSAAKSNEPLTTGAFDKNWLNKQPLPITDKTVAFRVMASQQPHIENMETNWFTRFLEQKANLKFTWELAPPTADSYREKLNLVLASGDLPDIILRGPITPQMENRYGSEEKIFIPLNSLIDKNMVNLKEYLKVNPNALDIIKNLDGNIYGLPNINECYHCWYSQRIWINQEWLTKVGMKEPTTTDELYQVLKAFKEKDPNGNGKQDEIPLTGSIDGWNQGVDDFIITSFILNPGRDRKMKDILDVKTKKIITIFNQVEYKQSLEYLQKLYKEGLLYGPSYTQKRDQVKQLAAANMVGLVPMGYSGMIFDMAAQNDIYRKWVPISPVRGPNGVRQTPFFINDFSVSGNAFVITKANKNPDVAMRFADLFYNYEIHILGHWGPEGVDWAWAAPGDKGMNGMQAMWKVLNPTYKDVQNVYWRNIQPEMATADARALTYTKPGADPYAAEELEFLLMQTSQQKMEPFRSKTHETVPALKFTSAESEEISLIEVELVNYATTSKMAFITGSMDINSGWDGYVKKLNDLGLQKWLDYQNKAYARQYLKK